MDVGLEVPFAGPGRWSNTCYFASVNTYFPNRKVGDKCNTRMNVLSEEQSAQIRNAQPCLPGLVA